LQGAIATADGQVLADIFDGAVMVILFCEECKRTAYADRIRRRSARHRVSATDDGPDVLAEPQRAVDIRRVVHDATEDDARPLGWRTPRIRGRTSTPFGTTATFAPGATV
jgi:hypothetical protein